VQHVIFGIRDISDPRNLEMIGRDLLPQIRTMEPKAI
jgi:hypothetical protein